MSTQTEAYGSFAVQTRRFAVRSRLPIHVPGGHLPDPESRSATDAISINSDVNGRRFSLTEILPCFRSALASGAKKQEPR